MNIAFTSAAKLASLIKVAEISVLEAVDFYIRRIEALVNEMAIQFCCCDTPVVLSGIAKTNGTVWVTRKTLSCRIERQFARR